MTDKSVLFFFIYVVPQHVPAADSDLKILVFFGVRLCVAQCIGIENVDMQRVPAAEPTEEKDTAP